MVGNGAWGGSIQYAALASGLGRGYATASTDTGHTGVSASFAMGHPEKLIDFGYRAIHETAVQGKATVAGLYNRPPTLSYFEGCSGGGRQAFMEAQRYPEDFDGIVAGAPGYNRTDQSFQLAFLVRATSDPASFIPAAKYPVLHRAALDACDSRDGATDGLISDPLRCQFDPGVTTCTSADGPDCLTAAAGDGGPEDLRSAQRRRGTRDFSGARTGQRAQMGGNLRRSAATRRCRRSVQVRRVSGPRVGCSHARSRQAPGAGQKDRQRHAQPDLGEHRAVRRTRRQAAHVSRLGRSEHLAALVSQLLRAAR